MLYTYPHYYKKFQCIASECEDTCCAGWAITIDSKSLEKYRHARGPMKARLRESVDWKQKCFKQREHRCAFLNEENLCDLYAGMGADSLCWTCRTYPRHIEVFDGVREVSLCLSCIEAARIILGTKEPVRFLSSENDKEESCEDEEFDFFLYTKLEETRDVMFEILENRGLSSELRMALCLALAHDLQCRIRDEKLYEVDGLLARYSVGSMCGTAQEKADAATDAGQPVQAKAGDTVARFCRRLASAGLRQQVSFIRCLKRWNHLTVHGLSAGTAWMKSSTEPEKKCMSQIAGLFLRQTAHAWSFSGSRSWCTLCSATFVELCIMIIHTAS